MDYGVIRRSLKRLKFSRHAKDEMLKEGFGVIHPKEVRQALQHGEVIEEYSEDRPYASCLVYGRTRQDRPLHIVCAPVPEKKHSS
ncbi:DUF4258 domain-containing protein [Candidatus Acetothermia bacterium]|nr:DUF4258 domain-containing protein [Candidatus Acetothermia bacterium]